MRTALYNGKVYVERGNFAKAVLVEDGVIAKVGGDEEILSMVKGDETAFLYDCGGRTVIPGLNDSHLHFAQFGEMLHQARIEGSTSIDDMIQRCRDFMEAHPEQARHGIHAIGWNQDLFTDEKRMPDRHDLDRISTEIPIVLERICGHAVTVNTKAIEMLGLGIGSPQYPGGEFYLEEDGYPNGIFTENACNAAKSVIPPFTLEERREMILDSMKYAVAHGLTSVQSNDIGISFDDPDQAFALLHGIYDQGEGLVRYRHQVCFFDLDSFRNYLNSEEFMSYGPKGTKKSEAEKDNWLTLGPLKLFKDGSLGARTAMMKDGYVGDRDNHGVESMGKEEMGACCVLARDHGVQVVTHTIGDEALSQVLDCYEQAFVGGKNQLRHAIVHCQISDQDLLERIVKDDVLVMAQPIFLDYDMTIVEKLCGKELASTSYAFGTLLRMGAHLSYGTDCPVEDCNPFPNLYMAITRKNRAGQPEGGFYPKECVDVETAVDAYTIGSAYNEFMEDRKGRIKEGYYGDMVVLDRDIFTVDPMEIKDILPVLTVVGGKAVYKQEQDK